MFPRYVRCIQLCGPVPGTSDVLADKFLASSYRSIDLFNGDGMKVDRGDMLQEEDIAKIVTTEGANSQSWEYPRELSRAKRANILDNRRRT